VFTGLFPQYVIDKAGPSFSKTKITSEEPVEASSMKNNQSALRIIDYDHLLKVIIK